MKLSEFWHCVRLELERESSRPQYGRFLREAASILFLGRFQRHQPKLPASEFLFVIITENHLKHFRPVAAELTRRNRSFSVIYTNEALFQQYALEAPGVSFPMQAWISRGLYFRAVCFQLGLLIKSAFLGARQKSVLIRFAKPAYAIHQVMLGLLAVGPRKVVLFKAEGYQANAVLLASKQLGVPSFAIQHGLIGDTGQVGHLLVDKYLVWSEFFQKRLEKWQAGCTVQVAGNAAYDAVFPTLATGGIQLLEPAPTSILVLPNAGISHTPLAEVHSLLEAVIAFAKRHPEARITVKPHPADQLEQVKQHLTPFLVECPQIHLLGRNEAIPFNRHQLVAVNNSGAGMEACIWERPLVVYSTVWETVQVKQYMDSGVAVFADSAAAFEESVEKILSNYAAYQEKCRAFVQEQLAFHGKAAEKIADLLTC